jgi:predicted RNA-binding Zn-ribbon protein involved in translation (DUF1610 family)
MKKFGIFTIWLILPFLIAFYFEENELIVFLALFAILILALWIVRGAWRFIFQPPGEDSWRFDGEECPYFCLSAGEGDTSVGLRAIWLREKLKFSINKRKKKKWQKELDALKEKYDIFDNMRKVRAAEKKILDIGTFKTELKKYGEHAPKLSCPHCGDRGNVWRNKDAKVEERSRESGIIGSVIGRKTVTEKSVTKLHCKNCGTSWVI